MKNKFFILVPVLLCTGKLYASPPADTAKVRPATFLLEGGNKVVYLTDYYTDYLKTIKKSGLNRPDSLYKTKISGPILNTYFATVEFASFAQYEFYMPIMDTTGLPATVGTINANRDKINKLVASTLKDCNKYLKNDSITVLIQPAEGGYMAKIIKKMGGNAGFTGGSKVILITIDPSVSTWSTIFPHTLAHEYHHACWTKSNFTYSYSPDVLTDLIFEGRADSYANIIYPGIVSPWDSSLNAQQITAFWNKLKPDLNNTDGAMYAKVMFGDWQDYKNYPLWGGYSLGYAIVQSALKNNPALTPQDWTNMDPDKILELSDFRK